MIIAAHIESSTELTEFKGITYALKRIYNITDPIESNFIIPSAKGSRYGHAETLVLWNEIVFGDILSKDSWIELTFPNRFVFPTAYSFRGPSSKSGTFGYCYAKSWDVYGIHEDDEDKPNKWSFLGSNDVNQSSTFCKKLTESSQQCDDSSIGTFKLKRRRSKIGYRHIRWIMKEGGGKNCSAWALTVSGIDIYGTLSTSKISKDYCQSNKSLYHSPSTQLIMLITSFLTTRF